ncbi:MurR/RpiR family transcriptional regulator [Lactobacillus hamsteri]|uniref:Rpir family regulatory protein n=1 Tax=Lactobacillus hamsteri DSM 5661 = JCM 6256 TaxID=1423754 RepID=A0A0R1YDE5_9LACO|nr:MurR/RpiR family transcriptional regulator [Lactobacillus hamsteri]KRM40303.1 rpir family regulatory protein [Lactobacillus hamsteri DSM 5661 = JCM 6256]
MTLKLFSNQQKYTNTEEIVITYLEKNLDNIDDLTINELAKQTHTSNASIIRLCHKTNSSGFPELKIKLIKEREKQKFINNDVDFSFPFTPADNLDEIAKSMTNLYSNGLKLLYSSLDMTTIEQIAKKLLYADRIFIFGIGDSGLTARSFINKVNKLNIYPIFASENNEASSNSQHLRENDIALIVTYGTSSEEYQNVMNNLSIGDGKTIIITADSSSNLVKKSDYSLIIPDEEKKHKVATFYSQFAFHYVLNLIFAILYRETILNN